MLQESIVETSSTLNGTTKVDVLPSATITEPTNFEDIQQKYAVERNKRIRPEGRSQYITLSTADSKELKRLAEDPWDDCSTPSLALEDGAHYRILIVGAGFGGLRFAVDFIDTGFKPEDIVIADVTSGFGGTWYWNRFPGLACDTESYIYLPLLEETGYIPKHKYSCGREIREHAERIAKHWSLMDRALFRTHVDQCTWNNDELEWIVQMTQRSPAGEPISAKVYADFVILAPGYLANPKVSKFPGLETFEGQMFHASRWNYGATGGSEEDPSLHELHDKRVGIIGTGTTTVQILPRLAKWSKHVHVFQRTPGSVDVRGQRATDPDEWTQKVATGPGWQWERNRNFNSFINNTKPPASVDLVSDKWTSFGSLASLAGVPTLVTPESLAEHIAEMHEIDLVRSTRLRARVDDLVKDPKTAASLKAWYPGWCKRPCFSDEYLQTFNLPNVTLVDTDGKGVHSITPKGVTVVNSTTSATDSAVTTDNATSHYDLDIIIFATGYEANFEKSPATRSANMRILGRGGRDMDQKWSEGFQTLHGMMTNDFPNMFFVGTGQIGFSPSFLMTAHAVAKHATFIVTEALKKAGAKGKVAVEPTCEAEQAWVQRVLAGALAMAPVAGCTPSFFNAEGENDNVAPEDMMKVMATIAWPLGMNNYLDVLQEWQDTKNFSELLVSVA